MLFLAIFVPAWYLLLKRFIDQRVYDLERQDKSEEDGNYTKAQYADLMNALSELNIADPNGNAATLAAFNQLKEEPKDILEIGFGLGQFSILLSEKFPNANVVGIDAHQFSVDSANENLASKKNPPKNVRFEKRNQSELNEPANSFDVITTTLVNHHIFPDSAFIEFLKKVATVGRKAFIFNDYHRNLKCIASNDILFLALQYIGYNNLLKIHSFLPESLSRPIARYQHIFEKERISLQLIIDGGMLSMRRSFSIDEYHDLFRLAGYPKEALQCQQLDPWYFDPVTTCRVVCSADLTWNK